MGESEKVVHEEAVIVQSDWNYVLKEVAFPKFFIGIRRADEKHKFFNIQYTRHGYEVEDADEYHIKVEVTPQTLRVSTPTIDTLFIAPDDEIGNVHPSAIRSMDVSCTGNMIVSTDSSGNMSVINSMNGDVLRKLEGHIMDIYKCRFFPSGMVVLSAGMDLTVRVWSVETGQCVRTFKGHTQGYYLLWKFFKTEIYFCVFMITFIFFSCYCQLIAVSCESKKIVMYNVDEVAEVCSLCMDNIPLAVHFDYEFTSIIYVGDDKGMISVYDINKKGLKYSCVNDIFFYYRSAVRRLLSSRGAVIKLLSRSEGLFVAFNDGSMCCYNRDLSSVYPIFEFSGSDCDPIYDFACYKKYLYTASRDKIIRKYKIP
uniref:WD_REPEATS_REGION domain-containing protein n=1 Tax=Heterorhabditis bacteriophora TaxID=37862 RepID=A0A1I7XT02_HETBA